MSDSADSSVTIQASPLSVPREPEWFGEVAAFAQVLAHTGILTEIQEQVRFARRRFGQYDLIDFVAVLIGSILSGEPTLLAFYERLAPFAGPYMALFGRDRLPHRSTLSRFLAALDQICVEAPRTLFQRDLLARKPFPSPGGVFDRTGGQWLVIDVDGTRATARQRALPQTDTLPAPPRRFDQVCAPGYTARKRGEVVRTRTVILQAHTHQFLGTFGGPGNGDYRGERATRKSFFWLSRRIFRHETSCFTRSILPEHAEVVTLPCEASGTMKPQPKGWHQNREKTMQLRASTQ